MFFQVSNQSRKLAFDYEYDEAQEECAIKRERNVVKIKNIVSSHESIRQQDTV